MTAENAGEGTQHPYLTVKEVAAYLHLNEKKIYALLQEGKLPGTKASGKWLFPKALVDAWLLETTQMAAADDRLLITGSDDPLVSATVNALAQGVGSDATVSYSPVGTRAGLDLLSAHRAHACVIHWGPAEMAEHNHQKLLANIRGSEQWALVRLARRSQGILLRKTLATPRNLAQLVAPGLRWIARQEGSGSHHFFLSQIRLAGLSMINLDIVAEMPTERLAASALARGMADCAPGCEAAAHEFNLGFLPLGWECLDLVVPRVVFFRPLLQQLLVGLTSEDTRYIAGEPVGYDLSESGKVVAGHLSPAST
ncbi:MAG: helix-turn-helix transcriptional regulator [Burkholderiales bacterium]|nr:helix-turn-helix transcriptional regulator [Burkholderiales bacterium]